MKSHLSFRRNPAILKNYSTATLEKTFTITIPYTYHAQVNSELKQYHARLGFDYDKPPRESYGIWFDDESYETLFILKWS